ncbi:serine hydrolase [Dawidia soli]|uniref:Beta-lactamase n=1 Tax=Dawidia soli TaxID=2782352 RepID=A0AAP2DC39_9BACT|nr:serine hydrolase [Dawidia soli]MBT1689311.1 serine hydrolase [Dawidia soli]
MLKKILPLLLVAAACLSACSQSDLPPDVKDRINLRVGNHTNPGIVIGLIDGDDVRYYSFGVKSLTTAEAVTEHTVFEIGSISKTFTGTLLANEVVHGNMKLDDPLQKYLPPGVTAPTRNGATIRLVNLSNHTSSLPRLPDNFTPANPANPYADYTEKQLYDFLKGYSLPRDIGSEYEYSNYAVGLLGHVLATQKKTTYEKLMIDVIATPLGMPNTRVALTPSMKKNLAQGYSEGVAVENWDLPVLAGAGGIRSDAVDMVKYIRANMGQAKSSLYPAMQLAQTNTRAANAIPQVGLGWHVSRINGVEVIMHSGGTGGYRSFAGFQKNGRKGVVVLTNSAIGVDDIGLHLLDTNVPITDGKPPVVQETEIPVDAAVLEKYIGRYELAPGFILTVTRQEQQLYAQATGQDKFPVFAKAQNIFFYKVVAAQLTFNQNAAGTIESVTLHQGGREIVGRKLE